MGQFAWDLTSYYSWVNNELLSLRDVTGASLGAINADDTRHFGIELGVSTQITDRISGRVAYTYQDFRFHDYQLRGDNRLAGAPQQIINTLLNYEVTDRWTLQGSVQWVPTKTPVDNMNTLYSDPYAVVDLRTEVKISDNLQFFGEVTNVFNEKYASSTLIVDQARADQAAFLPGDGRGFFVGLKAKY